MGLNPQPGASDVISRNELNRRTLNWCWLNAWWGQIPHTSSIRSAVSNSVQVKETQKRRTGFSLLR